MKVFPCFAYFPDEKLFWWKISFAWLCNHMMTPNGQKMFVIMKVFHFTIAPRIPKLGIASSRGVRRKSTIRVARVEKRAGIGNRLRLANDWNNAEICKIFNNPFIARELRFVMKFNNDRDQVRPMKKRDRN